MKKTPISPDTAGISIPACGRRLPPCRSSGLGPLFRDHVCEGDTGLKKAGNIALLARRHGLRCPIYVGDTASDERSAREVGCAFVFASYGFGEAERPDAVIASFSELPAAIDALKGGASHA